MVTARLIRALRVLSIGLMLVIVTSAPVGAATTAPVTPTTITTKQLAKQTTDTLRPLVIGGLVIVFLSFLANELGRKGRRQKRTSKRSKQRSKPRSKPRPNTNRVRPASPQRATSAEIPPLPVAPTASADRMWGRPAGRSAAERAAELEVEQAQWAKGSVGEQQVGAALDQLPSHSWWVFHDLPRGPHGTNIDHLVIGVGGVFSVNTKNLSGHVWVAERALWVDGQATGFIRVAESEAHDVSRRLSLATPGEVQAHAMLVFVEPATINTMPDDVVVVSRDSVRNWLENLPHVLTPSAAYSIVLAADRPATWI